MSFKSAIRPTLCTVGILMILLPNIGAAQAAKTGSTPTPEPSRVDMFAGYSYFHPIDSTISKIYYEPIYPGVDASTSVYFNRHIGLQIEGTIFHNWPKDRIYTAQLGPIFRWQFGRVFPFAHVLGGAARIGGPASQPGTWGEGLTAGLGVDYVLPFFGNHIAIRPIQADYTYSHANFGPSINPDNGGVAKLSAYRLDAGLTLRLGSTKSTPPAQLGCTIQPNDAYPGDPLTVTATPANISTKKPSTYTWITSGGQITGTTETASIATAGLAPGDYTVTGRLNNGSRQQAECTAGFRIHGFEPPTIACSANPTSVLSGQPVAITAVGRSPQNRILTYTYSASSGQMNGAGPNATLSTAGSPPGTTTVTCSVADDLGQKADAAAAVTITAPPPPPALQAVDLCTISFNRDRKRPVRVDNEAKGCLDDIAVALDRDSSAHLVLVGGHSPEEQPDAAAERSLNVELYLSREKGIDPARIELRTGSIGLRVVRSSLVPVGATFDTGSTATFDSGSIQRHGQPYAPSRPVPAPRKIR
jgi:hypothetical protein